MAGAGGEIRAVVRGIAQDTADAGENIAGKISDAITGASKRVIDSVDTVGNADGTSADSFTAIRRSPQIGTSGSPEGLGPSTEGAGSSEPNRIARLLAGEPGSTLRGSEPAVSSSDLPRNEWSDPKNQYPNDYIRSTDPPPQVGGPHEHPENWVDDLNTPKTAAGRDNNCAECSRSVDNTWHGHATKPAAMADPYAGGEPIDRMTDWAGQAPAASSMADINQRLSELGPGSSAVIGCDWKTGGGHWFSAVNDGGTIKAVDGQSGAVEAWPPSRSGLHFDETMMRYSDAIYFGTDGKVVKQ
jgi:hypothetical protein